MMLDCAVRLADSAVTSTFAVLRLLPASDRDKDTEILVFASGARADAKHLNSSIKTNVSSEVSCRPSSNGGMLSRVIPNALFRSTGFSNMSLKNSRTYQGAGSWVRAATAGSRVNVAKGTGVVSEQPGFCLFIAPMAARRMY
jgi:hypothetical protein